MNVNRPRPRAGLLAAAAAAIAVVITGCASASPTGSSTTSTTITTTSAVTTSATSAIAGSMGASTAAAEPHNQADIMFAAMMTPHHQGAIEMADLAPDRASNPAVKSLAAQIKAAQGPEIAEMTRWLTAWQPGMGSMPMATAPMGSAGGKSGMPGMGSGSSTTGSGAAMPGMMTDAQMQQLRDAKGQAFDTLFLSLMITHHQGAIEMADIELASGRSPAALALATAIKTGQTAEIVTMQRLLAGK